MSAKPDLPAPSPLDFIPGDSEAGRILHSIDWGQTVLGTPETWSPALRMLVPFVLKNGLPHLLWWGPDYICIYNDGYAPILGAKHPWAMGKPLREVWAEIWPVLKPLIDTPFNGGPATWIEDIELELQRHDFVEEAHFLVAYSPAPDETVPGGIGGVLASVHEITDKIIAERRLGIVGELGTRLAEIRSDAEACRVTAEVLARYPKDVSFALLYLLDSDSRLALAAQTGIDPAIDTSAWPLAEALRTEQTQSLSGIAGLPSFTPGVSTLCPDTVAVVPIKSNIANRPAGALVIGTSPRIRLDRAYLEFLELIGAKIATAIANERALEDERRRAAALAELDRAKTAFFSNVSHEFRTPLTLMLGPIEDSLADGELPVHLKPSLEVAHRNSLRLLKLVNSLLDFARIEAGRVQASYQPSDLASLTEDLASNFRSAMERAGLRYDVHCEPLPQLVHVDREMWEKIVLNLLSNAFKFTLAGSVAVSLSNDGDAALLRIADTGVGVPADEVPRLFERFHRVEGAAARTHEGSGIGLALVHELVKLHGGSVEASSELGRGTEFRIRLPYGTAHLPQARQDATAPLRTTAVASQAFVQEALRWLPDSKAAFADAVPEVESARADSDQRFAFIHGARVLLADDNADMRAYVRDLLGDYYEVEPVADGQAALDAAQRQRPDLIISDIMMPRLDGFGLLNALRADANLRDVPVILLSARAGEESRIEGLSAGADDYLIKPFSARELLTRVGSLLELIRTRRDNDERFRAFVQATNDVIYRMSADWKEMRFLDGRNFIADTADPSQSWMQKYIPGDEHARVCAAIDEAIAHGKPFQLEHRVLRPDGGVAWTSSRAIPMFDRKGNILEWFGAASDVTERRATQEALIQQRAQLEVASRQKDEFLAMLAHELRNPLAPIRNSGELLLRSLGADSPLRSTVHTIGRQVTHLTRIVDDLLDVSRITQGRIELRRRPVSLADIVARSLETVDPLIRLRNHKVSIVGHRWNLHTNADPDRLVQCLGNVLTNSAKYTPVGGNIRIETQEIDGEASIAITDDGVGIAPELLPKVFDLFVQGERTLDRAQGGLGIGLSLVKRLIEMHDGRVRISSPGPQKGTTFEIRLPLLPETREAAPLPASAESRSRKILVVDDNEDAAQTLAMILQLEGHEVAVAHSGQEVLQDLHKIEPEVILLDIGLPGLDGYQVAERIRGDAKFARIKLVALTGYGTETDRQRTQAAGFSHHLVKPVDFPDLKRTLDSMN